jgi:hypothetical protein
MLPRELKLKSSRVELFADKDKSLRREDDLNNIEEKQTQVLMHSAKYQQSLRRYYDQNVRERTLQVGDLALRLVQTQADRNKLSPKWEGPYKVVEVTRPGSCMLAMEDGRVLNNSWNIDQLRKFYV